jgi:hypothetical protein
MGLALSIPCYIILGYLHNLTQAKVLKFGVLYHGIGSQYTLLYNLRVSP